MSEIRFGGRLSIVPDHPPYRDGSLAASKARQLSFQTRSEGTRSHKPQQAAGLQRMYLSTRLSLFPETTSPWPAPRPPIRLNLGGLCEDNPAAMAHASAEPPAACHRSHKVYICLCRFTQYLCLSFEPASLYLSLRHGHGDARSRSANPSHLLTPSRRPSPHYAVQRAGSGKVCEFSHVLKKSVIVL